MKYNNVDFLLEIKHRKQLLERQIQQLEKTALENNVPISLQNKMLAPFQELLNDVKKEEEIYYYQLNCCIKPIRNDEDYEKALAELNKLQEMKIDPGSSQDDYFQLLTDLVYAYSHKKTNRKSVHVNLMGGWAIFKCDQNHSYEVCPICLEINRIDGNPWPEIKS